MILLSMSALCQMMQEKIKEQLSSLFKVEGILLLHLYGIHDFFAAFQCWDQIFISCFSDTDIHKSLVFPRNMLYPRIHKNENEQLTFILIFIFSAPVHSRWSHRPFGDKAVSSSDFLHCVRSSCPLSSLDQKWHKVASQRRWLQNFLFRYCGWLELSLTSRNNDLNKCKQPLSNFLE